jgi:hypothetical protein
MLAAVRYVGTLIRAPVVIGTACVPHGGWQNRSSGVRLQQDAAHAQPLGQSELLVHGGRLTQNEPWWQKQFPSAVGIDPHPVPQNCCPKHGSWALHVACWQLPLTHVSFAPQHSDAPHAVVPAGQAQAHVSAFCTCSPGHWICGHSQAQLFGFRCVFGGAQTTRQLPLQHSSVLGQQSVPHSFVFGGHMHLQLVASKTFGGVHAAWQTFDEAQRFGSVGGHSQRQASALGPSQTRTWFVLTGHPQTRPLFSSAQLWEQHCSFVWQTWPGPMHFWWLGLWCALARPGKVDATPPAIAAVASLSTSRRLRRSANAFVRSSNRSEPAADMRFPQVDHRSSSR